MEGVTTRSRTGAIPRKPSPPETPTRRRSTRQRAAAPGAKSESGDASNGAFAKKDVVAEAKAKKKAVDPTKLQDEHMEFGGSLGTGAMMIGFPLLMYYMWAGATHYDGGLPRPAEGQSMTEFLEHLFQLCYEGAFPHARAWTIYWTFLVTQMAFYMFMPGVYAKGQPLPHLGGKQLDYYCSAVWSFYATIALAAGLHYTGLFKLYTLVDEFGPIMSVAIITGFVFSVCFYVSAHVRGATTRMTGYPVYDFFMGAELNPRLFGLLDFKMFFEVRIPWFMLFFLSLGTAARQWEEYGYVSGEVSFLVMAHWLYANACSKGEHLIVPTWDMYFEKLGFMLTFWNLAGVPLTYCHCTIYLASRHPSEYAQPRWLLVFLFTAYLFVYWVWDTTNSQKNFFRQSETGHAFVRHTFPQLPWQHVKNPRTIRTDAGKNLLCDGWYGLARKIHYSCDMWFALNWGLITGFRSPFPWFYPVFFATMIVHRATRDIQRCRKEYGEAWKEYERQVPYLFIPYLI